MMTTLVDAESVLAIDIGSVNTRAFLFDVSEGRYRFVAVGSAPSTVDAPFRDVSEGVRQAIDRLHEITGRVLVGKDERLIIPGLPDGSGVDVLTVSMSAGPTLSAVAMGLLEDVSLESAQRLIQSTYATASEVIGMNDRRKPDTQIDAILRTHPDLIVIAGGIDQGASRSVMKLLEIVGLAAYLLPSERKPEVLFTGNTVLESRVKSTLEAMATVHVAPNIRPSFELEDLGPAQDVMRGIYSKVRGKQINGVQSLSNLAGGRLIPTSDGFGRLIRFLSKLYDPAKGVLGVDLGGSATTVASAFSGKLSLNVFRPLGIGEGLSGVVAEVSQADVLRWLPFHVSEEYVKDYALHKSLHPASVPATAEDLAVEQALAREAIRLALRKTAQLSQDGAFTSAGGLKKYFEPIVASGAVLARAPTRGQAMLMLLDALQPVGVTTIVLDQNNLAPALGAAAPVNSMLPVQILESGAFLNLGTVISPASDVHYGTPVLRIHIAYDEGDENRLEVKQGHLGAIPLALGQKAKITLEPMHRTDVGMGRPGRGGSVKVVGGILGLIIDARGRPLGLPADAPRRREMVKKWLWTLGG
jgi:uncharacterized protein (TIGR01319 family)